MALVLNGVRTLGGPANHRFGASALSFTRTNAGRGGDIRSFHSGWATGPLSEQAGFPNGAEGPTAWSLPRKGGGMSSYTGITGYGTLNLTDLQPIFEISTQLSGSGDLTLSLNILTALAVQLVGSGSLSAVLDSLSSMAATLVGSGNVEASLGLLVTISALMQGSGTVSSNLTGFATMAASLVSFGELSPEGLAVAVWAASAAANNSTGTMGEKLNDAGSGTNPWTEVITSGYTAAQILRILAAVAAGKTNIIDLGGGAATVEIRDLGDTKNVVVAGMTGSERSTVTLDGT